MDSHQPEISSVLDKNDATVGCPMSSMSCIPMSIVLGISSGIGDPLGQFQGINKEGTCFVMVAARLRDDISARQLQKGTFQSFGPTKREYR